MLCQLTWSLFSPDRIERERLALLTPFGARCKLIVATLLIGRSDDRLALGRHQQDAAVKVAVAQKVDDLGVVAGDRDGLVAGLKPSLA